MSTASEMTLAAETMMATTASSTMAAVAAAQAAHAASKSSPAAKLGFSIDSMLGCDDSKKEKEHSHIATALAEASRLRDSLTVADFSLALAARNGADNAAAAAAAAAAALHRPFNSSPNSPRSRH